MPAFGFRGDAARFHGTDPLAALLIAHCPQFPLTVVPERAHGVVIAQGARMGAMRTAPADVWHPSEPCERQPLLANG